MTGRSSRADSNTVDGKSKKEKRTLQCSYCGTACEQIEQHLMHDHPKEPKVMEALHFSNTLEERKRLLSLLCSNKKIKHDHTTRNKKNEDPVHCIFCQGYYHRSKFWKHALICEQKQQTEPGSSTALPSTSRRSRHSLEKKTFDPESGNLILCRTVQKAAPESLHRSTANAEHGNKHYLYSVPPGGAELNPIPDHASGSLSILYPSNSSAMNLDSESSGALVLESHHSVCECTTVQKAHVQSKRLTCSPFSTKSISEKQHQSTWEPENRLSNIQQPCTSVLSGSYLLDAGSSSLQNNTDQPCQSSSTQTFECSGKYVTPEESVRCMHTGSNDSQPTTNPKSDWTTIPTTVSVDLEQNLGSYTEPEKSDPLSESTNFLVGNIYSSDEKNIANPETENLFGNDERRTSDIKSHCHLISNNFPNKANNSETAKQQFDFEGHVRADTEEGGKCTGQACDLKPLGLNSTTTVKRKWDSRSRETKRRRQSDPLQVHLLC